MAHERWRPYSRRDFLGSLAASAALGAAGRAAAAAAAATATAPSLAPTPAPAREPPAVSSHRIDVHAHFVPDFYRQAAIAAGEAKPSGMPGWPSWDVSAALASMDRLEISAALLSISAPGVHFGDDAAARDLARAVNEAGAQAAAAHPSRFGLFASLPLPDVDASLHEIEHAFDTLKVDGIALLTNYRGLHIGNPRFDAVFAELDRREAVVFIHPTSACTACTGDLPYAAPMLEFMFETTRAVTHLLLSGTLARRPKIRFIVPHAGAALPTLSDRIAGTIPVLGLANAPSPDQIAALLRGLHYDLAGFVVPKMLPSLLAVAPAQQLLYGSDWPFTPEAGVRRLAQQFDATDLLHGSDRALIARENALRLFPRLAS
jgi:predicted TIM-barrel fold metal-dependent hydrolase